MRIGVSPTHSLLRTSLSKTKQRVEEEKVTPRADVGLRSLKRGLHGDLRDHVLGDVEDGTHSASLALGPAGFG